MKEKQPKMKGSLEWKSGKVPEGKAEFVDYDQVGKTKFGTFKNPKKKEY